MISKYKYSFLYALTTAVSTVLIQDIKGIPVITSLWICSLLASVFFHVVNGKKIIPAYKGILSNFSLWLWTSVTLIGVWWCTFYSTQTIGAANFLFTYFAARAAMGFAAKFYEGREIYKVSLGFLILLILLLILDFFFIETGPSFILGFFAGCFGGIFGYYYGKFSSAFSVNADLSPTQVLAVRFYLLIFILAGFVNFSSMAILFQQYWSQIILVTTGSFIIPLYFNQRGIASSGPTMHAILVACTPFIAILLQIEQSQTITVLQFMLSLILVLASISNVVLSKS